MNIESRLDELEAAIKRIEKRLQPRKRKNPSNVSSFNTTPEVLDQLKEEAAGLGLSRSELLRRIVKGYFEPVGASNLPIVTLSMTKEKSSPTPKNWQHSNDAVANSDNTNFESLDF